MTRTVLMLGYFFPPLGGGGVQRTAKFVKYLPGEMWRPVVVAAEPNRRNSIEQGLDRTLLPDVAGAAEIIRTRSLELATLYALLHRLRLRKLLFEAERMVPFLHMDYKIGWYAPALKAACGALSRHGVNLLYTTSPPYSAHFVGRRIKRLSALPWVADFRDPWTQRAAYRPPTRLHGMLERRLEAAILREADAVIANTDINRAALLREFGLPDGKVHVVPNGFDPDDFSAGGAKDPESGFLVVCAGKFYGMPDVTAFFLAFRRFASARSGARLAIYGPLPRPVHRVMVDILPRDIWRWTQRVDHSAAIRIMRSAAVLLANVPGERAQHWVPGKLYEYLAAARPIMFIGPEQGDAAKIVISSRTGIVVPNEEDRIYEALLSLYAAWSAGFPDWRPAPDAIAMFDRRRQTAKLASIFDTLVSAAEAPPVDSSVARW